MFFENQEHIALIKIIITLLVIVPIISIKVKEYLKQKELKQTRMLFNKKQMEKLKKEWRKKKKD